MSDHIAVPQEYCADFAKAANENKANILRRLNEAKEWPSDMTMDWSNLARPVLVISYMDGTEVRVPIQVYSEGTEH